MKVIITLTNSEGTSLDFRMVEGSGTMLQETIKTAVRHIVDEMALDVGDIITIKEYLR